MTRRPRVADVRREISTELLLLSRVLEDTDETVQNPDVLRSSANTVLRQSRENMWEYQVVDLKLRVDTPQNTIPAHCAGPLTVQLNLDIQGRCDVDPVDEVTSLAFDLLISSSTGEHVCAWHLDRHIEGGSSTEAHPLFHFQHGGHAMKEYSEHLGRSLLAPAPRMGCPPLDAILAIDFVLSNFAGSCWNELREEATYLRLLQQSQKRFWKPYWAMLASWWNQGPKDNSKISALWPHLA